jgi:hypothetical protein
MKEKKKHRRLIRVQMNLDELNSLPPLLRSRIISRAYRESVKERKLQRFQDALDYEEDL